jgi:hypothetical protein
MQDDSRLPNGDGTITYRLKHKMKTIPGSDEQDPKTIKLRPVYISDVEAMEEHGRTELGRTMILIARLSGWDIDDVRRLRFGDYSAIAGEVAARLGKEDPGAAAMLSAVASQQIGGTA